MHFLFHLHYQNLGSLFRSIHPRETKQTAHHCMHSLRWDSLSGQPATEWTWTWGTSNVEALNVISFPSKATQVVFTGSITTSLNFITSNLFLILFWFLFMHGGGGIIDSVLSAAEVLTLALISWEHAGSPRTSHGTPAFSHIINTSLFCSGSFVFCVWERGGPALWQVNPSPWILPSVCGWL